jgi:hypothetical protein
MIKRLIEILTWLPKAPTSISNKVPEGTACDYCGASNNLTNYEGVFCICHQCRKRVADAVLANKDISGDDTQ